MSLKTVETHLTHVYLKLGLTGPAPRRCSPRCSRRPGTERASPAADQKNPSTRTIMIEPSPTSSVAPPVYRHQRLISPPPAGA